MAEHPCVWVVSGVLSLTLSGGALAQQAPPPPRPESLMVQTFAAPEAPGGDVTAIHLRRQAQGWELGFSTLFMGLDYAEHVSARPLSPDDARELEQAAEAWRAEVGFAWGPEPRGEREGRTELRVFWDDLESSASLPLSDLRRARAFSQGEFTSPAARRLVALARRLAARERAALRARLADAPRCTVVGEVSQHGRGLQSQEVFEPGEEPVHGWKLERSDWNLPDGGPAYLLRDAQGRSAVISQEWLVPALHPQGVAEGQPLVFRPRARWLAQGRGRTFFPTRPLGAPADERRTLEELWQALESRPTIRGQRGLSDLAGRLVRVTGRALDTGSGALIEVERVELLDPATLEAVPQVAGEGLVDKLR